MKRSEGIARIKEVQTPWDVLIVGGGATGLGCALDSVSRGFKTLLLEQADFGNGTSTRSTKLVHGGVRYLRQGNVSLVRESLKEREWMFRHVPHQVTPQPFLIPTYSWWEKWYYRIGLWVYDRLAGRLGLRTTQLCDKRAALERVPTLRKEGLAGGVVYWDGQFDDARLCVQVAQTIWDYDGVAMNYMRVDRLSRENGRIDGVEATDCITGERYPIQASVVIQATGIFSDTLRKQDSADAVPMIRASRGSHVVVDGEILPNKTAVMVPKTNDGRLLFLVPWLDKVIVGTTDIPDEKICLEPKPTDEEIDFILENAQPYLKKPIRRSDIRSVFSGLRPLVMDVKKSGSTASLARNHVIEVTESGFITIAGGKWTTFRKMGEEALDKAIEMGGLDKNESHSEQLRFHGYREELPSSETSFSAYGSDADRLLSSIAERPELGKRIHANLSYTWAEVLFAIEEESAESVEDVLARRTRALFLDAEAAVEVAPAVADFMALELDRDPNWAKSSVESFLGVAENYRLKK